MQPLSRAVSCTTPQRCSDHWPSRLVSLDRRMPPHFPRLPEQENELLLKAVHQSHIVSTETHSSCFCLYLKTGTVGIVKVELQTSSLLGRFSPRCPRPTANVSFRARLRPVWRGGPPSSPPCNSRHHQRRFVFAPLPSSSSSIRSLQLHAPDWLPVPPSVHPLALSFALGFCAPLHPRTVLTFISCSSLQAACCCCC